MSRQRQLDDVVNTIDRVRAGLPTGVGLPSPRKTDVVESELNTTFLKFAAKL